MPSHAEKMRPDTSVLELIKPTHILTHIEKCASGLYTCAGEIRKKYTYKIFVVGKNEQETL